MYKIAEDNPSWLRDDTGALVNANAKEYDAYLKQKRISDDKQSEIQQIKSQINNLNNNMKNIENMLSQLINMQGNK